MKIKSKVKKLVVKIIRLIYKLFYKYIPINEKTVIYIAFHGRGYNCNPKYLHKYMLESNEFKDYKFIWAIKKNYKEEVPDCKVVRYNGLQYFYYLARSKYWIVNCKLPKYIMKKDNQVYLQTWHGTPLKRLAHDIESKEEVTFYRSEMSRKEMLDTYDCDVKKYDYFISPNKFSTDRFKSAFKVDNSKIIETGYPRNDFLIKATNEDISKLRIKYNIPNDKKVILYAPTWRDNSYSNKGYSYKLKVDFNLWKEQIGSEYIVLFKPHYLIVDNYSNDGLEDFVYIMKESVDINELYVISDILVTDYSSVFFDYALLERPILFYMYDLEEYRDELRGFYLDINKDLPGEIFTDENSLIQEVKSINDKESEIKFRIREFNKRFNELEDGRASERVVKTVFKTST